MGHYSREQTSCRWQRQLSRSMCQSSRRRQDPGGHSPSQEGSAYARPNSPTLCGCSDVKSPSWRVFFTTLLIAGSLGCLIAFLNHSLTAGNVGGLSNESLSLVQDLQNKASRWGVASALLLAAAGLTRPAGGKDERRPEPSEGAHQGRGLLRVEVTRDCSSVG